MDDFSGACHCKSISWKATFPVKTVVRCHCENCRRLQGSDYSTWVVVASKSFQLNTGASFVKEYKSGKSSRSFCPQCGTTVYLRNGKHFPDDIVLPLGIVESYSENLKPQAHVYTGNMADWVKIQSDEQVLS